MICCGGKNLILVKKLASTRCKVIDNLPITMMSKMTKKKGDANTLTITFECEGGNLVLWKFSLNDSLHLCSDISEVLATLD